MSYRHEAAAEHSAALDNLIAALMADLNEFAVELGRTGTDPVFVFAGAIPESFDPNDEELHLSDADYSTFCETLGALTVADSTGKTRVTMTDLELWPEAVDLWSALRSALSHRCCTDVGPGLVIDTARPCAAAWGPLYCPDEGAMPDMVVSLASEDHDDPFNQLFQDNDANLEACHDRIQDLMIRYELDVPATEAHPAGACG